MARPLRLHQPGAVQHVTSRGNNRQTIFAGDDDYSRYLELLAKAARRFEVVCLAYCLMPNHIHLLLRASAVPLSRLLQQLNSTYCQAFNRCHGRVGHVLQGRPDERLVDNDAYFMRVVRYIARNPAVAKLVSTPRDWLWSSHRATAGEMEPPEFLDVASIWRAFDPADRTTAQHLYRVFVASEMDDDVRPGGLLLGSAAFRQHFQPDLAPHQPNEDFLYAERFAARPELQTLLPAGIDGAERDSALRRAFLEYAYTLKELSTAVGRPSSTVWSWIQRAEAKSSKVSAVALT